MRANANAPFAPIFDAEPTLSVGAMALDPTTTPNPTLYVATGEGDGSNDSYYGEGIFVSSDLGGSWSQLGASNFDDASIGSIAIDTTQTPRTIYAAVTYGSSANRAQAGWIEHNLARWESGNRATAEITGAPIRSAHLARAPTSRISRVPRLRW